MHLAIRQREQQRHCTAGMKQQQLSAESRGCLFALAQLACQLSVLGVDDAMSAVLSLTFFPHVHQYGVVEFWRVLHV